MIISYVLCIMTLLSECLDSLMDGCLFFFSELVNECSYYILGDKGIKYLVCQFLGPGQNHEEDIHLQAQDMGSRSPTIHHFNHSSYFCISFYTEPCSIQSVPKAIAIRQKHMILHIKKQHSYIVYIQFIIVCQRTKVCWILQQ